MNYLTKNYEVYINKEEIKIICKKKEFDLELDELIKYINSLLEILINKKAFFYKDLQQEESVIMGKYHQLIPFNKLDYFLSKDYFASDKKCYLYYDVLNNKYYVYTNLENPPFISLGDKLTDNELLILNNKNSLSNTFKRKLVFIEGEIMEKFDENFAICHKIFFNKTKDYGPTWIYFRLCSLIDQLWIKIMRIRNLEQSQENLVGESKESEYYGIINYCIIGILSFRYKEYYNTLVDTIVPNYDISNFNYEELLDKYNEVEKSVKDLLHKKNHDYGNAWMEMRLESITDQIIIKTARIKNILINDGKLLISEDIDAQLSDIINYCIFSLIKIKFE